VRGNPDATSDLDMYVIHRAPFRQRLQKLFHGVPAEIFVNPPVSIESYIASEQANGGPSTAHMLATGFVVLDRDPAVEQLREKARLSLEQGPTYTPQTLLWARYMAATRYEDARDIAGRDPQMAQSLLSQAVTDMLFYRFQQANRYYPRTKDLLRALKDLDPEAARLARAFFSAATLKERLAWAGPLADRTIATRGFFEWEGEPQAVPENQ
jgi:hypothetical protein